MKETIEKAIAQLKELNIQQPPFIKLQNEMLAAIVKREEKILTKIIEDFLGRPLTPEDMGKFAKVYTQGEYNSYTLSFNGVPIGKMATVMKWKEGDYSFISETVFIPIK